MVPRTRRLQDQEPSKNQARDPSQGPPKDSAGARIRFHGELNEFLPPGNRDTTIHYPTDRRASVKDVIEALGPPHTEVGRIVADGRDVDFSHLLTAGSTLDVHPLLPPVDVTRPTLLRPEPLDRAIFLVDLNVAKLAMLLRLLGLDAAYDRDASDKDIAERAATEGRIVLSRDRSLLKRKQIVHGRVIRAASPSDQLDEVLAFYGLSGPFRPFSRCVRCNVDLLPVAKDAIDHLLQPLTRKYFDTFRICPRCGRIYWPGSHHDRLRERLRGLGIEPSDD